MTNDGFVTLQPRPMLLTLTTTHSPATDLGFLRAEFQTWANSVAARCGYNVRFLPVGPKDLEVEPPTQMAFFLCVMEK